MVFEKKFINETVFLIKMEQLDQSGYELCKLHGSNTNAKYELNKRLKKIVNWHFGINDWNENVNNHLCSLNIWKTTWQKWWMEWMFITRKSTWFQVKSKW